MHSAGALSEWLPVKKSPTRLCPFPVLVQHPSWDGDEGDSGWISRWTTNWRSNVMNLRYADDIILLATLEAERQELVDCLDWVSHRYSLLINIDKTKVMASDGTGCCILIQNEQLAQVPHALGLWLRKMVSVRQNSVKGKIPHKCIYSVPAQGCHKLANRSQPLVGRSSAYCDGMWMRYCWLTKVFFSDCRCMP